MATNNDELERFRKEWAKEIGRSGRLGAIHSKASNRVARERSRGDCTDPRSESAQRDAEPSSGTSSVNSEKSNDYCIFGDSPEVRKRKNHIEPFVIAENLLRGDPYSNAESSSLDCSELKENYLERNKKLKLSSAATTANIKTTDSFIDIFISDINEITDIPFFDIELPRELALKIFKLLSPLDLCRCSQVSKAWKSLADDELLWNKICHELGYDKLLCVSDDINWKEIVKNHVVEERRLQQNWKMRTGKYQKLEHVWGKVITSVHSNDDIIVAGYTTGDVKFWDLRTETESTLSPTSTALVVDESAEQGMITNYVHSVIVGVNYTAALFNQGNLDIWENYGSSQCIKSMRCFQENLSYTNLQLVASCNSTLFACCFGDIVQVYGSTDTPQAIDILHNLSLEDTQIIQHLKWISSSNREGCLLAIGGTDTVSIHKPGHGCNDLTQIHNVINQKVTCIDGTDHHIAVAVSSFDDHKVRLYNIDNRQEEVQFRGHKNAISCLNMEDSPKQSLVTGCHDKRVRIFDTRQPDPVMTLRGHGASVTRVQMDDWKVASGSSDGMVCLWDQRVSNKLWDTHNRHPVGYLHFNNSVMTTANLPLTKFPQFSEFEEGNIVAKRDRGTISVYNFSDSHDSEAIPEICLSTYDQPEAYNYNIRLTMPYDNV